MPGTHTAILVSGLDGVIYEAHSVAMGFGLAISPLTEPGVDGCRSFAVWPDVSPKGESQSLKFQEYLQLNSLAWIEVSYGASAKQEWVSVKDPKIDQSWLDEIVKLRIHEHVWVVRVTAISEHILDFRDVLFQHKGYIDRSLPFFLTKVS